MNGYASAGEPYSYKTPRLQTPQAASGRATLQGYQNDIVNGFEKDAPRYNPMNAARPHSSALLDLKDPIQVHLLTETALTDSKEYEILSQEEVDDLKKQCQAISQRIETTRQHLAMQAKFRDAANSMAKLGSPGKNQRSGDEEAEIERLEAERKCEELASELFNLEKRLMEPSRRLLEHTAGILQLTHRGDKKKNLQDNGQPFNGIPGSPESLYTYSQERGSLDAIAQPDFFDDAGLYRLDGMEGARSGGPEVPMKSPVRAARDENTHLVRLISDMEQRFEVLTTSLRETIVRFNPEVNDGYDRPPHRSPKDNNPGDLLQSQVEYLESGLVAVQAEQESSVPNPAALARATPNNIQTAERVEALNSRLREVLMSCMPDHFPAPMPVEPDVGKQLAYLEDSMGIVDSELTRAAARQSTGKMENVMHDLWNRISTGYAGLKQQNAERRRARTERGMEPEDDASDDEGIDTTESYTLDGFHERIEWLYRQATTLKDQKSVLKRQIKQQRELNNKSDAEKDEEIAKKQEQMEESRLIADRAEKDAMDAQKMLSEALEELEEFRAGGGASGASTAEMEERNAKIEQLEDQLRSMQGGLSDGEMVQGRLAEAEESAATLRKDLAQKDKELTLRVDELEQLNMTLAELKTELTIARAELDGAYGSRAERAADVAALKNSAEVQKLVNQVEKLKKELGNTVKELEEVTKETIGSEREKSELEAKLDEALSVKTHLESEAAGIREKYDAELEKAREAVHKLQHELDGERLKAQAAGTGKDGKPGASMLSEQFRSTMRDQRKKWQDDLKEERARNRRLEEELGKMKKSLGQGKSPLSPKSQA